MARNWTSLWFGDERGYNATSALRESLHRKLWFGDERGYNATTGSDNLMSESCGLVMKEDITQRRCFDAIRASVVVW